MYTEFPLGPFAFTVQQHLAPRVLQANRCSSTYIEINQGSLAGWELSVPLTRMLSLRSSKPLVHEHPHSNTKVFVDDTSMIEGRHVMKFLHF